MVRVRVTLMGRGWRVRVILRGRGWRVRVTLGGRGRSWRVRVTLRGRVRRGGVRVTSLRGDGKTRLHALKSGLVGSRGLRSHSVLKTLGDL